MLHGDSDLGRTSVSSGCGSRSRRRSRVRVPFCQQSQMARVAEMNSFIRAAGRDHSMEKRRVMCGLICDPSPRMKRPSENAWRSHPMLATSIGLRANATAMPVPSSIEEVLSAARMSGKNGSCEISALQAPPNPTSSRALAAAGAATRSGPSGASTNMAAHPSGGFAVQPTSLHYHLPPRPRGCAMERVFHRGRGARS